MWPPSIVRFAIVSTCAFGVSSIAGAQSPAFTEQVNAKVTSSVGKLTSAYPEAKVEISQSTGLPTVITGLDNPSHPIKVTKPSDPNGAVSQLLAAPVFKSLFPTVLDNASASLEQTGSRKDPVDPRQTIVTYRQKVAGIPVFGSEAKFTVMQGLTGPAVSGGRFALSALSPDTVTTYKVDAGTAQKAAEQGYEQLLDKNTSFRITEKAIRPGTSTPGAAELKMFDPSILGETQIKGLRPTWVVNVGTMVFFVDANSGSVIHEYRNAHPVAPLQINDFNQSSLAVPVAGENNIPPLIEPAPAEAAQALHNAQNARTYFTSINRNFLGGCTCDPNLTDPPLVSLNIRFPFTVQTSMWDGISAAYFSEGFASAPDVVVHELMHGITEFSSCITYDADPGAVSEFFSDFFAAVVRQQAGLAPWVIGDSVPGFKPPAQPVRSFSDPHLNGFNPSANYSTENRGQASSLVEHVNMDSAICASGDLFNHCAHINSGILNHGAYLAVEGLSFNGRVYQGIGMQKMVAIMNATLSLLGTTTNLRETAAIMVSSCGYLQVHGAASISATDCSTVSTAFQSVGLIGGLN